MTVLTQTQRILSITVVTHNRQHRMVLCSTPSMFFLAVPSVAKSRSISRQPIVTGTSVLAVKYKDGIMMAADNLGSSYLSSVTLYPFNVFPIQASYGSLARFKGVQRLHPVGDYTVVGASGDMSDFQYLQHVLDGLVISEETNLQDGHTLGPAEIHEYLSRVMYQRRSKMDPLWNSLLVGGVKDGKRSALLPPRIFLGLG